MFRRKLEALNYHNAGNFDANDEQQFRNLVVWLEDQKIRQYKIEERTALRTVSAVVWQEDFHKFLAALSCPIKTAERNALLDWLLGYAVRLEYGDNVDKYKVASADVSTSDPMTQSSNPLSQLDFDHADFKAGVASLAKLLQIPSHPDHIEVLKAITIIVQEKLSKVEIEKAVKEGVKKPSSSLTMDKIDLGFETDDYISSEAAKVLRLLHVRELRRLQTSANEAIIVVQVFTANPKTDTRLGKVGR